MGWSSLQILVFQLACLIQVTDNVQEILLWELHAGKMEHEMIKCFFELNDGAFDAKFLFLLFCRMAPEVLQPGSGYNSK